MLLEFEAILGQISAHSLATGPVTVEPIRKQLRLVLNMLI